MTAPCLNCPDRAVGCKTNCERYAAFRAQVDERRRIIDDAKDKARVVNEFKTDSIRKTKRKKR